MGLRARWQLPPRWPGVAITAFTLAAGAGCFTTVSQGSLLPGVRARHSSSKTARQAATAITEEEVLREPRIKKKRRGRIYVREDGEWKQIVKEQPLPAPAENPSELRLQIDQSGKALRLLQFLENAVHSPAFEMKHAVRSLDTLVMQRPSLSEEELAQLNDQSGLAALVGSTEVMLSEMADDQEGGLGPRWSAQLMYALAVYQDIPLLNRLVVPVAEEAAKAVPDMNNKQIALCVWAVAELKQVSRLLQDNLLPLMVQNSRILGVRSYLKAKAPFEHSLLKQALFKLRRDVPYLREFLPGPE